MSHITITPTKRLLSLDFMRGLIMVLLALESTELYVYLLHLCQKGSFAASLMAQFFHNDWRGIHFWDLIQPAFMFMAGIAMTYSLTRQKEQGMPWNDRFLKILKRSALLLCWGIIKRIHSPDWLSLNALDVTDILTQLAFTTIIAFLLFDFKIKYQLLAAIGILVFTEFLYRFWNIPGYVEGFSDGRNIGSYIDYLLFQQEGNHYVFINWLPTAVHTLAGVIVGKLFMQYKTPLTWLLPAGLALVLTGYALDFFEITLIIKPIASSSFVLVSLGFCCWMVALCYWWIDLRKHQKGLLFFQVVGMNSIFIYLFFEIVGRNWFNGYVIMVFNPMETLLGLSHNWFLVIAALTTFAAEWGICYFLYRKKIFFKL
ncbi:DUF5009 domain-containing protein [Pedobacter gandavensis]|uniref:acyltransferase family protein n=1 Tax=Pedobacter gandavensis TaxID=2679963 RepID=UPI00292E3BF9|nr:DUF5009 domain-containing protein [Pedobacter gandavensis]